MEKEGKDIELEIRRKIYKKILKSPGLHQREISRLLKLPLSTLDYHLTYLKKRELVTTISDGHYTRYYSSGSLGLRDKEVISCLRQDSLRKIILYLLNNPNSRHRDISNHLDVSASTSSFHLNKLLKLEIIQKVETSQGKLYFILKPYYISDLIISYKKSFLDKSVDHFVDTWISLSPKNLQRLKGKRKK